MAKEKDIILASGSPRRIQIMKENGIVPVIMKPEVNETLPQTITMEQAVMYLALKKAQSVEMVCGDGWIIGADTVVYKDRIVGKPKDYEDAVAILKHLREGAHLVATGVAILEARTHTRSLFCEVTKVFFKDYSDEEIDAYIASGEVWDKAGAYAIQGGFAPYIDHIEGDYDNVVGFPWQRICEELQRVGCGVYIGRESGGDLKGKFLKGNRDEKKRL